MLANGTDPSASMFVISGKETALSRAISKGRADVARVLLDAGADPNAWEPYDAPPPLVTACLSGRTDLVKLLLDHGASPMANLTAKPTTALLWLLPEVVIWTVEGRVAIWIL